MRSRGQVAHSAGIDDDTPEYIEEINERYALALVGGNTAIIQESNSATGREVEFLTVQAFRNWFANQLVWIGNKRISAASLWLSHPRRRQYRAVVFDPGSEEPDVYNLWRGFSVTPKKGDCSLFKQHLLGNVCDGRPERFDFLWGFLAQMVQQPAKKLGIAIVLRGDQGTGKSKVGEIVGSLFKRHYVQAGDPRYLLGQFNSHLRACLLFQVDEGIWAGDKAAEGKLKDLVTAPEHLIEMKGKEPIRVKSCVRVIFTSNSEWVVPAGLAERRFAVFDVGNDNRQDRAFFAAIDKEMDEGGREALLYELLQFDLQSVDLNELPRTEGLLDQKIASLPSDATWLFECLKRGGIRPSDTEWPTMIEKATARDCYVEHAKAIGVNRRATETMLGKTLRRFIPKIRGERPSIDGERRHVYILPPLEVCRAAFESAVRHPIDWDD